VTRVLFVCVGNAGRSVMAERLFHRLAGGRHLARSAGSDLGSTAHPEVLEVLREVGIDASDHVPHKLDADDLDWADIAVSTCSEEVCPVTRGVRRLSWEFPDPKTLPLEQVRLIRDRSRGTSENSFKNLTEKRRPPEVRRCAGSRAAESAP
jgi:arsenate reductase